MDRIELALRGFRRIRSHPRLASTQLPSRQIEAWLRDDVLPVVDEFSRRPTFREYATWPLRILAPGVDTLERRAVDAVDAALVASAESLGRLARNERVARR